ncbi:MAG: thioredoxin domain-containing protein [Kiloniellaceae bacterium]
MTSALRLLRALHVPALAILWLGLGIGAPAQGGRLSDATSPYLLSHADDAIDWYPWGEEALERARREDKLIFLSIGYASCYWCHVLARTTFADQRVIETLNEHFLSILVDRDERPDLDRHFMEIMLAMTGRSGSPANFLLTPDVVPLFAAGYLAPDPEYGEPGFVPIVQALVKEWTDNRDGILSDAEMIRGQLRDLAEPVPTGAARGREDPRESAARSWSGTFDEDYGGFGRGPKFLLPNVLSFLLHRGVWRGDAALLENVFRTLDRMAAGGVRDQLGGAFHRYAVDRFWQVPHFEIMLNENALLARLYLEAYQASGKPRYAAVAREILDDLLVRFRLADGGFAAALDSETEGREGLFYTWTAEEVRAVLGAPAAEPFIKAYVDESRGLVDGRSVLRLLDSPESLLRTQERLAESRSRLLDARAKRAAPLRDDKVLTSWNALAVSAFAKAAQVLDDDRYLQVARKEITHLLVPPAEAHRLPHSRRGGKAAEAVFLDDYAFLIQALLDLYETDFEVGRLDNARALMEILIERFQEEPGTPFRFTPIERSSDIPARTILNEEGAPSGNAAALIALHRLVLFGADAAFEGQARAISRGLGRYLELSAPSATGLLRALDFRPNEAHEIVIVGNPDEEDTRSLLREVYKRLRHGTVLALIAPDAPRENEKWPLLAGRPLLDDKPTAYVCKNRLCDLPVDTPAELSAQLDKLVSQVPVP